MIKNTYIKNKDILSDYFWRALQLLGKEGVVLFIFILSAKLLTPFEFGNFNYFMASIFFLILFGDFGISAATSKFVAEFNETSKEKLKTILFNATILISGFSFFVIILVLLFGKLYFKEGYTYILLLLPLIFLAPMTSLYDGIFRGLKKFKQLTLISVFVGALFLPIAFLMIQQYGLVGAFLSQTFFYCALLLALSFFYREWHLTFSRPVIIEISKYSLIIGITSLGYFFFTRINVIILGHFGYIEMIGSYEIINKLFVILLIPFAIFSQVIAPRITGLFARGEKKELMIKYKQYLAFVGIISVVLAFGVYTSFPLLMRTFLPEYSGEIVAMLNFLLITLVTQSVSSVAAIGFSTASGHAKLNMYFLIVFGITNVILTSILIIMFGFWGVIYSTVAIKIISDVSFVIIYYNYIKK